MYKHQPVRCAIHVWILYVLAVNTKLSFAANSNFLDTAEWYMRSSRERRVGYNDATGVHRDLARNLYFLRVRQPTSDRHVAGQHSSANYPYDNSVRHLSA